MLVNNKFIITDITKISNSKQITSLGDVKLFLEGFNNGDNLKEQLDTITQTVLKSILIKEKRY